jgi:hypothetical protein
MLKMMAPLPEYATLHGISMKSRNVYTNFTFGLRASQGRFRAYSENNSHRRLDGVVKFLAEIADADPVLAGSRGCQ